MNSARKIATHASRPRGRPREFDMDDALDKAIRLFRERGYHASSVEQLTDAMELASGSIYKAFKDKRAVFLAAYDRYTELRTAQMRRVDNPDKSGRERIRDLLQFFVDSAHGAEGRRGCLVVGSAVEMAVADTEIAARVRATLSKNESALADLIAQGQADGSVPYHIDAKITARTFVCMTQGLRVIGKTGRTPAEMAGVVETAMKILG